MGPEWISVTYCPTSHIIHAVEHFTIPFLPEDSAHPIKREVSLTRKNMHILEAR